MSETKGMNIGNHTESNNIKMTETEADQEEFKEVLTLDSWFKYKWDTESQGTYSSFSLEGLIEYGHY